MQDDLEQDISHLFAGLSAEHLERVRAAGEFLAEAMRREVSGPSPSVEGNPPGLVTGRLRDGIHAQPSELGVTLTSDAPYSTMLEVGTRRMMPRPFFQTTIDANENLVRQILYGRPYERA